MPTASVWEAPKPSARTALPFGPDRHPCGLDDVSAERVVVRLGETVRCVELHEPVTRSADEAARGLGEGAVERRVDGLRVVAVRRVRRRVRVGGDEHRVPGGADRPWPSRRRRCPHRRHRCR